MSALVRYDQARQALAECARIDEAAEIRDKAAALAAYARQREDRDMEVWVREIQLRASVRIGELSRELDRAPTRQPEIRSVQPDIIPKREALAQAGISKSTAHEYEHLAGGRDVQAQHAGKAAMEHYFAKARADREPATMAGLRVAVKDAVVATVGSPPARPQVVAPPPPVPSVAPVGDDWVDWVAAVATVSKGSTNFRSLATRSPERLRDDLLSEARYASARLSDWIEALEDIHDEAA